MSGTDSHLQSGIFCIREVFSFAILSRADSSEIPLQSAWGRWNKHTRSSSLIQLWDKAPVLMIDGLLHFSCWNGVTFRVEREPTSGPNDIIRADVVPGSQTLNDLLMGTGFNTAKWASKPAYNCGVNLQEWWMNRGSGVRPPHSLYVIHTAWRPRHWRSYVVRLLIIHW